MFQSMYKLKNMYALWYVTCNIFFHSRYNICVGWITYFQKYFVLFSGMLRSMDHQKFENWNYRNALFYLVACCLLWTYKQTVTNFPGITWYKFYIIISTRDIWSFKMPDPIKDPRYHNIITEALYRDQHRTGRS